MISPSETIYCLLGVACGLGLAVVLRLVWAEVRGRGRDDHHCQHSETITNRKCRI